METNEIVCNFIKYGTCPKRQRPSNRFPFIIFFPPFRVINLACVSSPSKNHIDERWSHSPIQSHISARTSSPFSSERARTSRAYGNSKRACSVHPYVRITNRLCLSLAGARRMTNQLRWAALKRRAGYCAPANQRHASDGYDFSFLCARPCCRGNMCLRDVAERKRIINICLS